MSRASGWVRWGVVLLRPLVWLWPSSLRSAGSERELVLEEVLGDAYATRGPRGVISRCCREAADAIGVAVRARPVAARSALAGVALLGCALLLPWEPGGRDDTVVVSAVDAAGEFTLTLHGGRLVAASVDRIAYPADRLVQTPDSLRVLNAAGRPVVAVSFEAPGTIRWEPRGAAGP